MANPFTAVFFRIGLLVCIVQSGYSQVSDVDYKKHSAEVRAEVWNWNKPAFKNRTIPAEYANSSSVVLAHHTEISAKSKSKFHFMIITGTVSKELYYINTVRELVKINDKAALDEYSEISFQRLSKRSGAFISNTTITMVGVRVIKPDGTVKEINADEAVMTKDAKNDKQGKLALSDLQVGDMVDYFVQVEEQMDTKNIDPLLFVFGKEVPVLDYSIHCEIGKKFAVEYRSMNGAPDFTLKRDAQDDFILDAEKKNIAGLPTGLWMSAMRQVPILRLNIVLGYKGMFAGRMNARGPGEVYHNMPFDEVLQDIKFDLYQMNYALKQSSVPYYSDIKVIVKAYKKNKADLPKDSIPAFVYYAARHLALNNWERDKVEVGRDRNYQSFNNKKFMFVMERLLHEFDVDCDYVIVASRYGPDLKQVMSKNDIEYMLRTRTDKPVFLCAEGVFTQPGYVLAEYEGQESPTLFVKGIGSLGKIKAEEGSVKVPVSSAMQNKHDESIQIKVSEKNPMQLILSRTTRLKGHLRTDDQKRLLLFEQYEAEERNALGIKETLLQDLADSRKTRNLTPEYEAAFATARKEQAGFFKDEIKSEFDIEPKELMDYKIVNSGILHERPDMIYNSNFLVEGWIKKAGNNYIIDAGKFIGEQLQIKPEQRNRTVDVYMSSARSFQYEVQMTVPQGYKAEGMENLNKEIQNDCGSFVATAKMDGDKITIKVTKVYKNAFEPVGNWPKLLQIIDGCSDWTNQKIMLRKG